MITVKNVLDNKVKPFITISSQALVIDALNLMNAVDISYLVVMDGNEYKGIFSERDYSRTIILKGRASNSTKVQEVLTTNLPVVTLTDTVVYCMQLMNGCKARYLSAYDGNQQFAGIITFHDLLRQVIDSREAIFNTPTAEVPDDIDKSKDIY